MDINQIKELAKILLDNSLTVIEMSEGTSKIRLEKTTSTPQTPPVPVVHEVVQISEPPAAKPEAADEMDFSQLKEVKSPMVGVFYTAPAPGEEPFVKIGDRVQKGDVLCIIEAMKLMNEITATCDGVVADICAEDGQVVEFSQPLFRLS